MIGKPTWLGIRAVQGIGESTPGAALTSNPPRAEHAAPDDLLLQTKYGDLTRKHLGHLFDRLFAECTGLNFHVAWAPSVSGEWDALKMPAACSVCCRLAGTRLSAQPACQICGPTQLARVLAGDGNGLAFTCRLGVRNSWLPIRVRGVTVGVAYLQALAGPRPFSSARDRPARFAARGASAAEFGRARRLLRLIIEHVQTLDLAELRKDELTHAGHAVLALEQEQARLHDVLQRHLPAVPSGSPRAVPESHAEQIVHNLLALIQKDYATPLTLQRCAGKLQMNAAYLSALFSRAVGVPFKTYLTTVRMEKAKALLGDAKHTVSEVAWAVGYGSENRFRGAFRKATGLAPKLWREALRIQPVCMVLSLLNEPGLSEGLALSLIL